MKKVRKPLEKDILYSLHNAFILNNSTAISKVNIYLDNRREKKSWFFGLQKSKARTNHSVIWNFRKRKKVSFHYWQLPCRKRGYRQSNWYWLYHWWNIRWLR